MCKISNSCPVCGGVEFESCPVIWAELRSAWQLSEEETGYINKQQGYTCVRCRNNLRSMCLAACFLREVKYCGTLDQYCLEKKSLRILEINRAGSLTPFFKKLQGHRLVEYPCYDMQNLDIESGGYDIVIHSDTLEHVPSPERGMSECCRVLGPEGVCIFTVPMIVDRLSRSRVGLPLSYHGQSSVAAEDQVVFTEFGADAWKTVIKSGFLSCEIYAHDYPAAVAIIARK